MDLKVIAAVLVAVGLALTVTGAALIYPPAAFILAGLGLAAVGLFAIDVKE